MYRRTKNLRNQGRLQQLSTVRIGPRRGNHGQLHQHLRRDTMVSKGRYVAQNIIHGPTVPSKQQKPPLPTVWTVERARYTAAARETNALEPGYINCQQPEEGFPDLIHLTPRPRTTDEVALEAGWPTHQLHAIRKQRKTARAGDCERSQRPACPLGTTPLRAWP